MTSYWTVDLHTLWQIFLAVLLGGAVGYERERHGRDAGLRTHIIVCLASTLILIGSRSFAEFYHQASESLRVDPSRIAAGIVTGIGFLGAGTIIRTRDTVHGLTTAACLWLVSGIGIVVGTGAYLVAVVGTLVAIFVLYILGRMEKHIVPDAYCVLSVTGESSEVILLGMRQICADLVLTMKSFSIDEDVTRKSTTIAAIIKYKRGAIGRDVVARAREIPGVSRVSWGSAGGQ